MELRFFKNGRLQTLVASLLLVSTAAAFAGDPPSSGAVDAPTLPDLVVNSFANPPCNVSGFILEGPKNQTGAIFAHEARFTWGRDLPPGPCFTTNDQSFWTTLLEPAQVPHTASKAFPGYVGGVLKEAKVHRDAIDSVADPFGLFTQFFGVPASSSTTKNFLGYTPLRARWLRSQWSGGTVLFKPEKKYVYEDFFGFQDIRLRGARLYCAARRAQREQDPSASPSLGERVAYRFNVLNHDIEFLVLRSTVVLNGPQRCTGGSADAASCLEVSPDAAPNDGAKAFEIPLLFGTRLIPIRGLPLPDLAEVRVPMVLVTGDTEVKTLAHKRPVFVGYVGPDDPLYVTMHSKEYQTVTHSDAILSAGKSYHVGPVRIPLFTLAAANVFLDLTLDYGVGAFQPSNDRVIDPQGVLAAWGWPVQKRSDQSPVFVNPASGVRYHDGPWRLDLPFSGTTRSSPFFGWRVLPDGQTDPFWTEPILPVVQPHDVRALTDDDHAVASRASATLMGSIAGELGADFGLFTAKLKVSGGVGVTVAQDHLLRDALMAQDPLLASPLLPNRVRPMTALSVRTRGEATLNFPGLTAGIHFRLSLPFKTIKFDKKLFNVPGVSVPLPNSDEPPEADDEQLMFRLGTGSKNGLPMTKPIVRSHLPQQAEFEPDTFDVDVPACLADPTPNPEIPPPCEASVGPGETPHAHVCLYGPTGKLAEDLSIVLPPTVCSDVAGYLSTLPVIGEPRVCLESYLDFLCEPTTSQWQTFEGSNVVARVWDFDGAMANELYAIVDQCVNAFADTDAQQVAESLISAAVCRPDATLLGDTDIMNVVNPNTPPEAKPAPACGW